MSKENRHEAILQTLRTAKQAIPGSQLAFLYGVSRQIVVKDIAALRLRGAPISSTPKGYVLSPSQVESLFACCHHDEETMKLELFSIVELGGTVVNVIIDHPFYGELCSQLHIQTHKDVVAFIEKMREGTPLCSLTNGLHVHTVRAADMRCIYAIAERLSSLGILVE